MQDEPELGVGFSRKMSLNGDGGMLSIDHQNGRFSDDEHRANPGVGGRQQRRAFTGQRRGEKYEWVEKTLVRHEYAGLRRPDKSALRLYIGQMVEQRSIGLLASVGPMR
jgi:hypothetical protein